MGIVKAAVFLSCLATESTGVANVGKEGIHSPVVRGSDASFNESVISESLSSLMSKTPAIGFNSEGGSVFTNYVNARRTGQFFHVGKGHMHLETFNVTPYKTALVHWCSQLAFTDVDKPMFRRPPVVGYTAHCLHISPFDLDLTDYAMNPSVPNAPGKLRKIDDEFKNTVAGYSLSISLNAVYVPQTNIFEIEYHSNTDNFMIRVWDDGSPTSTTNGWEVDDAGDTSPMAAHTSYTFVGKIEWATVENAAHILGMDPNDFTPKAFDELYLKTWGSTNKAKETSLMTPLKPWASLMTFLVAVAGLFAS